MKAKYLLRLVMAALLLQAQTVSASEPEATFTTNISNGWERVERYRSAAVGMVSEPFLADGRADQSGQLSTFFGTSQPASASYLLHYAPGWNDPSRSAVLLVHGANQDADIAWANPNNAGSYGCGKQTCPTTGLMQHLSSQGFAVFAVTFAHKNGDGFIWSQIIGEAIQRITDITQDNSVDVVGWSKGAFNARMYVSSVTRWNQPYQHNVGKLVMLGGPNNGIDWSFRHGWNHTFAVYPECGGVINGPTAHDAIVCYGLWHSGADKWTYDAPFYPGSAQMLKNLTHLHSLPMYEQDWYTTYYGGTGYYSYGRGLAAFTPQSLVDEVRTSPTALGVQTYNLCGSRADIALVHNEHTGPSDGVVFTSSCLDQTGLTRFSGSATLSVNHLQLGWHSSAKAKIAEWLASPSS